MSAYAASDAQLLQLAQTRPPPFPRCLVRHGDCLAEMADGLLEGGAAQGLVAALAPPFDGEIVEAGLREMMGDDFWRGCGALGLIAQDFRGAAVQRLAAAFQQAVVRRVLDQRVLEAIVRLMARAFGDEEVRAGEPIERRLERGSRRSRRPHATANR